MKHHLLSDRQIGDVFAWLADRKQYVFLDTSQQDALSRNSYLFVEPKEILRYRHGEEREAFLHRLARLLDEGCYLAGWFAYEFLSDRPQAPTRGLELPAAEFGVYERPLCFDHLGGDTAFPPPRDRNRAAGSYRIGNVTANMEEQEYCRAVRTVLEHIAAGDTYQVNYTFKLHFDFEGSVSALYRDLRRSQPVPYGACLRSGEHHILSFSPELFFRTAGNRIIARPMKGTIKRGRTGAEDEVLARRLHDDEKNRSENVMIVDLLRNDLSRLVEAAGGGTVSVSSIFDIERYRSVFQMTSTVVADRRSGERLTPKELLEALFPCGSVTGAPKIRTMEIIEALEKEPRGVYTGAIGFFGPDGTAVFNVPIRTVVLAGRRAEMGIGSGIVADSSPEAEWRECLLKARFLTDPPPSFELIETMLHRPGSGYLYLEEHLDRLAGSADFFGFACDRAAIRALLLKRAAGARTDRCSRVRLSLSREGAVRVSAETCDAPSTLGLPGREYGLPEVAIGLADTNVDSGSLWLYHKTTERGIYSSAYRKAREHGLFDVVFGNERGEITEGCITNVIVRLGGRMYTPPLRCGLLDGVMRRMLVCGGAIEERVLYRDDLLRAERIYVCNSVRGVLPARLVERDPAAAAQ